MLFSSLLFLWLFLPLVAGVYYLLPKAWRRAKNGLLLVASLFFYGWGEPVYILLMLASITLNWGAGLCVWKLRRRTAVLAATVAANLLLLGYFKYFDFAAGALNALLGHETVPLRNIGLPMAQGALQALEALGLSASAQRFSLVLPLGISFYTFQALSYVIDLYRGEIKVQKNWFLLALYVSFFPQLIAGPIVRYADVEEQLARRTETAMKAAVGIKRFLYGLAKKVILANCFAAKADEVFALDPAGVGTALAWLGALYYRLQIYYDFSGYSDMAIGLGAMFGFTFPENFDYPYLSASVGEFWRRWHISLSSWLKDYLYISLGGNRKGKIRTYINLLITMLLGGLWHGASMSFIIWGAIHGVALAIHKFIMSRFSSFKQLGSEMKPWRRVLGILITFHLVCFGWIFFRADSIQTVKEMLSQIFTNFHPEVFTQFVAGYKGVFILMVIGYVLHFMPKSAENAVQGVVTRSPLLVQAVILAVMIFVVVQFKSAGVQPFIYFQF